MLATGPEARALDRGVMVATWIGLAIAAPFVLAQDLTGRIDRSRQIGRSWELDPVFLHRRHPGNPCGRVTT